MLTRTHYAAMLKVRKTQRLALCCNELNVQTGSELRDEQLLSIIVPRGSYDNWSQ